MRRLREPVESGLREGVLRRRAGEDETEEGGGLLVTPQAVVRNIDNGGGRLVLPDRLEHRARDIGGDGRRKRGTNRNGQAENRDRAAQPEGHT